VLRRRRRRRRNIKAYVRRTKGFGRFVSKSRKVLLPASFKRLQTFLSGVVTFHLMDTLKMISTTTFQ